MSTIEKQAAVESSHAAAVTIRLIMQGKVKIVVIFEPLHNGPPCLAICHQRAVHRRKLSQIVLNTNTYFALYCNVLVLFTHYALPSGGKSKDVVVHFITPLQFVSPSVTRWLGYLFNIWHPKQQRICTIAQKFCQSRFKILLNLVTLYVRFLISSLSTIQLSTLKVQRSRLTSNANDLMLTNHFKTCILDKKLRSNLVQQR